MTQANWSTDNIHVFDSAGRKAAKLEQDSEHGDLIVTAVNSHDGLLAFVTKISKFQLTSETISPTAPVNQTEGAKVLNRLTSEARELIEAAR